jgi:hypothetical protein
MQLGIVLKPRSKDTYEILAPHLSISAYKGGMMRQLFELMAVLLPIGLLGLIPRWAGPEYSVRFWQGITCLLVIPLVVFHHGDGKENWPVAIVLTLLFGLGMWRVFSGVWAGLRMEPSELAPRIGRDLDLIRVPWRKITHLFRQQTVPDGE